MKSNLKKFFSFYGKVIKKAVQSFFEEIANYYYAAGGILMLWVYYTSAIFLFGATITHFRAKLKN